MLAGGAALCAAAMAHHSMVALDMDGTLLGADHVISDASLDVLRRLSRQGVLVSLCTGRATPAITEHIARLALPHPVPVVAYNGALCLRCEPGQPAETLFTLKLPLDVVTRVLKLAEENGHLVQYYVGDSIYVACKTEEHRQMTYRYAALVGVKAHVYVDSYDEAIARGAPYKMLLMTHDVEATYRLLETGLSSNELKLVRGTPPFFVEVLHPKVNKGVGLQRLCEALEVPTSEVVAFGDGDNDIEFLQVAGMGYAMKNARPALKQVSSLITEKTNDEDGVAFELDRMQRQGQFVQRNVAVIA